MRRIIGKISKNGESIDCIFDNRGLTLFNTKKLEYDGEYSISRINCSDGYFQFDNNQGNEIQVYTNYGHIEIINECIIYPELIVQYRKDEIIDPNMKINKLIFVGGYINKIFPYIEGKHKPLDIDFKINRNIAHAQFNIIKERYYDIYNLYSEKFISKLELYINNNESELKSIISAVNNLIGILCNCRNVIYDNIEIYSNKDSKDYRINDFAYANISNDKFYREQGNCINIRIFNTQQISKLFNLCFEYKGKKTVNFDFLQKHNQGYSVKRICDIVNGIESLLNISEKFDIRDYKKLYKKICLEIDNSGLDDDAKTDLKNGAKYINHPIKERIRKVYERVKKDIDEYYMRTDFDISNYKVLINNAVEFRNVHTHRYSDEITKNNVNEARFIYTLLYYLIFEYIGCKPKSIISLMYSCMTEC